MRKCLHSISDYKSHIFILNVLCTILLLCTCLKSMTLVCFKKNKKNPTKYPKCCIALQSTCIFANKLYCTNKAAMIIKV